MEGLQPPLGPEVAGRPTPMEVMAVARLEGPPQERLRAVTAWGRQDAWARPSLWVGVCPLVKCRGLGPGPGGGAPPP